MISRKIVAAFDSREAAQSARDSLLDLGVSNDQISITDQSSSERNVDTPQVRGGFWSHVKAMFMPEQDRHTVEECVRRGGCVLVATVADDRADEAVSRVEGANPVDLEARESEWRTTGWDPAASPSPAVPVEPDTGSLQRETTARQASRGDALDSTNRETATGIDSADREATVPVIQESLQVGKREVNRGGVRVRSYIVEEPVHEEVRLRDEHVDVQRRPVQGESRLSPSNDDAFQERTVEVSETAEQAVVGKEARVTEEVVVSKTANDRVERIDDTVRHTEVEVQDDRDEGRSDRSKGTAPGAPQRPAGS